MQENAAEAFGGRRYNQSSEAKHLDGLVDSFRCPALGVLALLAMDAA